MSEAYADIPGKNLAILESQGYPSPEWFDTHLPVESFLNTNWVPHPERLLKGDKVEETNPGALGTGEHLKLQRILGAEGIYNPELTVLDVGGGSGSEPFSLLKQGPFVYILDPRAGKFGRPIHPHRVWEGHAEDMPFKDRAFYWALSTRAVGWYPEVINPFWAISEMVRVAKSRVNITIGQDGEKNRRLILEALEQVKKSPVGQRIKSESLQPTELALLLHE